MCSPRQRQMKLLNYILHRHHIYDRYLIILGIRKQPCKPLTQTHYRIINFPLIFPKKNLKLIMSFATSFQQYYPLSAWAPPPHNMCPILAWPRGFALLCYRTYLRTSTIKPHFYVESWLYPDLHSSSACKSSPKKPGTVWEYQSYPSTSTDE